MPKNMETVQRPNTRYKLTIVPAIDIKIRHKIQDFLSSEGYNVSGGGQYVDGSACDITFSECFSAGTKR